MRSSKKSGSRIAKVGTRSPNFSLWVTDGTPESRREVTLDDYVDRWLVLLFYPRDFSIICPTELTSVSKSIDEFSDRECEVLAISTDDLQTHEQWLSLPVSDGGIGELNYPLGSDPDGSVCELYGVYFERMKVALRGLFIIDPNGVLQYQVVHSLSVGRKIEEVLRVLDGLQSGGYCAGDRERGQPTINLIDSLGPNRAIGQFQIEARIGGGTFGTVFRARDKMLDRTVALKVLRSDSGIPTSALLNEARTAASLNHPNVCTVYSVESANETPMIVMEYVAGHSLAQSIASNALSNQQIRSIVKQIAEGMAAAHESGVVHGDLKPANLIINTSERVKIMDFGLARRVQAENIVEKTVVWSAEQSSSISGTPRYMSPEQTHGLPATAASDAFSFGLIVYEMLAGSPAVTTNQLVDALHQINLIDGKSLSVNLPEPFAEIVRRTLVNNPAERTLTMKEISEMLTD